MELRDYFRGLRRHWLAIALMTLVGLGASFGWVQLQTPVYESSASGLIQIRDLPEGADSSFGDSQARSKVDTYLDMATWQRTADTAAEAVGLSPSVAASRIRVQAPSNTAILRVTAQGETPEDAAALAEAWIVALGETVDEYESIDGVPAPLQIIVASQAAVPTEPVFPDLQTSLIVGGVLGLGFGIAFALIRTVSDRRIRNAEDVEARTQLSVVGTIPLTDDMGGDDRLFTGDASSSKRGGFAVAESLRTLRTNLQFMDVDNPPRTIVVTSPLPSDGKSTVACNLALTLAASGRPVVIVDGDLRRSTVAKTMGVPGGAGLSDVLSGRAEIADVLQRSPASENLFVLTAGSTPPNPSEVLGSARMRSLLTDLARHAMVIIDAPPLIPVTDGAVLTHQADGALIVVSLGKTTYDLLDKSIDTLEKSRGRALGIVINKVPMRGVDSTSYSYEYRRTYGAAPSASPASPDAPADDPLLDEVAVSAPGVPPKKGVAKKTPGPARSTGEGLDALFNGNSDAVDAGDLEAGSARRQRARRD
ncbi:polysaccharide biosynthesis tyrosine autokinase [Microbacterium sp. Marseille-Q6648]|uniref:polysaccharide biosynthesis tyrosine autokinase n=1 Tax=Microbacterium sp. Marseille-Q6648 TaxID=2937991 RepID=UPI00203F45A1|nr:polysaccharide biosynthesis tyrosine autokinase [Microbacterium sp. Marseille-Q6648]